MTKLNEHAKILINDKIFGNQIHKTVKYFGAMERGYVL